MRRALVARHAVPAVAARLARLRDRVDPPRDPSGVGIEAHDLRAAWLGPDACAGRAHHDLAPGREHAAGNAFANLRVPDALVPHELSGLHVERDDVGIGGPDVQAIAVERHTALHGGRHTLRQLPPVLPEQIARPRVERLHAVAHAVHEEHAVVHERRRPRSIPVAATSSMPRAACATLPLVICVSGLKPCASHVRRQLEPFRLCRSGKHRVSHRGVLVERAGTRDPGRGRRVG